MIKSSKLHISEKFGIAPNELLNNPNISLRAKGLFTYIQSKPNGWDFSVMRITLQMKDGRKAIMTAVRELEELGYLLRKPARNNEGQWTGYIYTLSQTPLAVKGSAVKGSAVKGITLSKKDIVKKNIVFNIFWDLYNKKNGLKSKVEKKWNSLTDKDRKDIINYIPKYIQAQPDKQFRKHPMTFLNNESWKDELISNNKPKKRKVYFQGDPVYEKKGKQWVVSNGEWREFVGKQEDLEIKFE